MHLATNRRLGLLVSDALIDVFKPSLSVPMETLTSDVAAIVSGMAQADKESILAGPTGTPDRLTIFVTTNKTRVDSIQQQAEKAKTLFSQTIEWFGEAQNKPSPETFFGLISRFIENFKVCGGIPGIPHLGNLIRIFSWTLYY